MLVEFVLNNAFLTGAVALLGGASVYLWSQPGTSLAIDSFAVVQQINQHNARIIDIRQEKEFAQGRIAGAQRINASEVESKKDMLIGKRPLVLVCANGQQSLTIARKLQEAGCKDVAALRGGIRAWREANQPTLSK